MLAYAQFHGFRRGESVNIFPLAVVRCLIHLQDERQCGIQTSVGKDGQLNEKAQIGAVPTARRSQASTLARRSALFRSMAAMWRCSVEEAGPASRLTKAKASCAFTNPMYNCLIEGLEFFPLQLRVSNLSTFRTSYACFGGASLIGGVRIFSGRPRSSDLVGSGNAVGKGSVVHACKITTVGVSPCG